jgi:hypothetical protein
MNDMAAGHFHCGQTLSPLSPLFDLRLLQQDHLINLYCTKPRLCTQQVGTRVFHYPARHVAAARLRPH